MYAEEHINGRGQNLYGLVQSARMVILTSIIIIRVGDSLILSSYFYVWMWTDLTEKSTIFLLCLDSPKTFKIQPRI